MALNFDEKDLKILRLLQRNCRLSYKEVANAIGLPVTTAFARIKRLEEIGLIKGYKAVLNARKLNRGTTAFILASFSYRLKGEGGEVLLSQRDVAREIANFPEVQEVHIIAGDWDLLIKVKDVDIDAIGRFVIDKLRLVKGIEKTLTCVVFSTEKETSDIAV